MKMMREIENFRIAAGLFLGAVVGAASVASGSGFGLYEASSPAYAMGGAVVGRAIDASANFYNPATLTDLTNLTVTAGLMTEHPRARIKTNGGASECMDPGVFVLPHFHLAAPLPWDLSFGLGVMPEYGLGSQYDDNWALSYNSQETTVSSFTVNPNLAWKWNDLSVGAGLRFLYFDFEQYSHPIVGYGANGYEYRFHNRLKGDNGMNDFGYQVGLKYDVFDNFSVGLVYKSLTIVHVRDGKTTNDADDSALSAKARGASGKAETDLELPQSITGGFNWDITRTWHLGGTVAWTQWSSICDLDFRLAGTSKDVKLRWNDTWRAGLAPSWDFAEDWTAIWSYVYENDCCGDQESTMLPAADRHMLSMGLVWRCWRGLEVGLTYGLIIMDGKETQARESVSGRLDHYRAYRGLSHAAGLTLTYRF